MREYCVNTVQKQTYTRRLFFFFPCKGCSLQIAFDQVIHSFVHGSKIKERLRNELSFDNRDKNLFNPPALDKNAVLLILLSFLTISNSITIMRFFNCSSIVHDAVEILILCDWWRQIARLWIVCNCLWGYCLASRDFQLFTIGDIIV